MAGEIDRRRRWGTVDWYGERTADGRVNDYGFISVPSGPDVHVAAAGLEVDGSLLREGTAVTFVTGPGSRGRPTALEVRLLVHEQDLDLLTQAVRVANPRVVTAAGQAFRAHAPDGLAAEFLREAFGDDGAPAARHGREVARALWDERPQLRTPDLLIIVPDEVFFAGAPVDSNEFAALLAARYENREPTPTVVRLLGEHLAGREPDEVVGLVDRLSPAWLAAALPVHLLPDDAVHHPQLRSLLSQKQVAALAGTLEARAAAELLEEFRTSRGWDAATLAPAVAGRDELDRWLSDHLAALLPAERLRQLLPMVGADRAARILALVPDDPFALKFDPTPYVELFGPNELLASPLLEFLPLPRQVAAIVNALRERAEAGVPDERSEPSEASLLGRLASLLSAMVAREGTLPTVPLPLVRRPELGDLPDWAVVALVRDQLRGDPVGVLPQLSWQQQIFAIYYFARSGWRVPDAVKVDHRLVRAALRIHQAERRDPRAVADATELMEAYVRENLPAEGWPLTRPVTLAPLLPACTVERVAVEVCEARRWVREGHEYPTGWCPRTRKECEPVRPYHLDSAAGRYLGYGHARFRPIRDLWVRDWTLHELIEAAAVRAEGLDDIQDPDEYVNQLAGWVNRLNEVRLRLRCSGCRATMENDYTYALRWAALRSTVANCQGGPDHDDRVYLHYCRGCRGVIDSRESRFRHLGLYVCIRCGSGHRDLPPATVCPACDEPHGMERTHNRWYACRACGHQVQVPSSERAYDPATHARWQPPNGWAPDMTPIAPVDPTWAHWRDLEDPPPAGGPPLDPDEDGFF